MRTKLTLPFVALLLLVGARAFADPDPNCYVFLCFGQSNMESGGRMADMDRTVDKRFQVMADFDSEKRGWKRGNWYDAVPPISARGNGICMIDYFGRTMVANLPPNVRVGVIKCSVPGAKIELFEKDTFQSYAATAPSWMTNFIKGYDGNPYQYLVSQARLAQKDGVIKGILLHQGESNAGDKQWPNKVKGIYDNLIKDLDLKPEDVPLLAGETVNADQKGVCAGVQQDPGGTARDPPEFLRHFLGGLHVQRRSPALQRRGFAGTGRPLRRENARPAGPHGGKAPRHSTGFIVPCSILEVIEIRGPGGSVLAADADECAGEIRQGGWARLVRDDARVKHLRNSAPGF